MMAMMLPDEEDVVFSRIDPRSECGHVVWPCDCEEPPHAVCSECGSDPQTCAEGGCQ